MGFGLFKNNYDETNFTAQSDSYLVPKFSGIILSMISEKVNIAIYSQSIPLTLYLLVHFDLRILFKMSSIYLGRSLDRAKLTNSLHQFLSSITFLMSSMLSKFVSLLMTSMKSVVFLPLPALPKCQHKVKNQSDIWQECFYLTKGNLEGHLNKNHHDIHATCIAQLPNITLQTRLSGDMIDSSIMQTRMSA